jgi:hypothetical protein
MADELRIKYCVSGTDGNCGLLGASDLTGAYEETDNPYGYGGPNSPRSQWRLGVLADLTLPNGGRSSVAVTPAAEPELADRWTVASAVDGVYEILLIAALPWEAGDENAYHKDNVCYGSYLNDEQVTIKGFFKALADVDGTVLLSDPLAWKLLVYVSDFPLLSQATVAHFSLKTRVHLCFADHCVGLKAQTYARTKCTTLTESVANHIDYFKAVVHYSAAVYAARLGNYPEARWQIELLNKLCESCLRAGNVVSTRLGDCGCG